MTRSTQRVLISLAISLCAVASAHAQQAKNSFYGDSERGWYFYERDPEPVEQPKPEPPQAEPEPEEPEEAPQRAERAPITPPASEEKAEQDGPEPFSAQWLSQNMEKFKQRAIDNPTEQNVAAYMMLQRLSMDKASQFAQMTRRVRLKYPRLDETIRRPGATFAKRSLDADSNQMAKQVTGEVLEKAGLWFFYEGRDCSLCERQAGVIRAIERQHPNATVWPITMDGFPLRTPNGQPLFPNRRVDEGHAERLGITKGPAVVLVTPGGDLIPIARSPMALTALEDRIRLAAVDSGLISRERYEQTRHVDSSLDLVGPGRARPQANPDDLAPDGVMSSRAVLDALGTR